MTEEQPRQIQHRSRGNHEVPACGLDLAIGARVP
jgi:hypothetical protein